MEPAWDQALEGRVLEDRYRILTELGAGGMGAVYRAEHLRLGREVALKVLLAEYGDNTVLRGRFEREAKALAALSHPNVVTVTDYGVAEDLPYLVMELLEGQTLRDLLSDGPVEPGEAFRILREILRGLSYAHSQGLVHRDLKPGNVFLQTVPDTQSHVKLLDFGLAKFLAADEKPGGPTLTRTGSVLGTPAYMAPEQASGDISDKRSDVYAAGILLLEMLAGERPFDGDPGDVLRHQLLTPVPPLSKLNPSRAASPELEAFLAKATAKERPARFQTAGEMLTALEALPQPAVKQLSAPAPRTSERPTSAGGSARGVRAPVAATVSGTAATLPGGGSGETPAAARRSTPGGAAPSTRKSILPLILGAGGLVALLGGFVVVAAIVFIAQTGDGDGDEAGAEAHPGAAGAEVEEVAGPHGGELGAVEPAGGGGTSAPGAVQPTPDRAAAPGAQQPAAPNAPAAQEPNPWQTGSVPRLLAQTKAALDRGQRVSRRAESRVRAYAGSNRDDPRGHILLGRIYLAWGWRPDAIARYELAYEMSPTAAGDPAMLEDLVTLAAHTRTSSRAVALLQRAYGRRALPAIDAALSRPDLAREDAERLRAVRSRL